MVAVVISTIVRAKRNCGGPIHAGQVYAADQYVTLGNLDMLHIEGNYWPVHDFVAIFDVNHTSVDPFHN